MEIVVHGTKGGRQIFTPKKLGGLLDVNSDVIKASAIGQEAYAIRFIEKTIIFSKYRIIRDVRGDKRTGFLGFSLFLPTNKKLLGVDIISVLDEVSGVYYKMYFPENDNNLKDVREDWAFLDRILDEYKTKLLPISADDIEYMLSGAKDDAFIYFENDEKLQKYFDAPYQVEYSQYRQLLFVKEELKDKAEDPLNALRHSEDDLSGKIDLENLKYKLIFNQATRDGLRIDVKVNHASRHSNSKIRLKDELEISWSKQFCETVTKRGNWEKIGEKYIEVNSNLETVTVKGILLEYKIKTIALRIKDWQGKLEKDTEVTCKSDFEPKPVENNILHFKGEELGKRWIVSAKTKDNRFYSEGKQIDFEKDCPDNTGSIEILLNKNKPEIKTVDSDNGDRIEPEIINPSEFVGEDIGKPHRIAVSYPGYKSKTIDYSPLNDKNQIVVKLEKIIWEEDRQNPFKFGPDKQGVNPADDNKSSDVEHKKKKRFFQTPKFIVGSVVGAIIIGFGILALLSLFLENEHEKLQQSSKAPLVVKTEKEKTDSTRSNDVKNKPINDSSRSLDRIADPIKNVSGSSKAIAGKRQQDEVKLNGDKKEKNTYLLNNNEKNIIKKLKTDTVRKDSLDNWKDKVSEGRKKSIELYLKFWRNIANNEQKNNFEKLRLEVVKDKILNDSELEKFLIKICANSDSFDKFNKVSGKLTCKTIADLNNKMQ